MLTPEDLKKIPESFVLTMQALEEYAIRDIARRIKKQGELTETAKHQIERIAPLGADIKKLEAEISTATGVALADIDKEIRNAIDKSVNLDMAIAKRAGCDTTKFLKSKALTDIISAGMKQTLGELKNISNTMGFRGMGGGFESIKEYYQSTLNFVTLLTSNGSTDYITAARLAAKSLTQHGLEYVDYASGHRNRVDVACKRAIITGVNQMNARLTELQIDEFGAEYVETTAHAGARPDHALWQGQVYHIGGFKGGHEDFEESTQYGDVTGLCGANCRHSFFPFFPGVSKRVYSDDELASIDPPPVKYEGVTYTHYEANQKQRAMERAIRRTKREIAAADGFGDKDMFHAKSISLRGQKAKYKDFSKKTGLRVKNERTQELKFGRSIVQKSRQIAKTREAVFNDDVIKALQKGYGDLRTKEVVLRAERIIHIKNRHPEAVEIIVKHYKDIVANPSVILKDRKNPATIINIKEIESSNYLIVIKLNLKSNKSNVRYKNSIITGQILSKKRLLKYINKHKVIYKKEK